MKTIFFVNHSRIPGTQGLCIFLCLATLFIAFEAQAQTRGADRIVTLKKDTLLVKLKEIGRATLTYNNLEGDTSVTRTIARNAVQKVFFGNGDIEDFGRSRYTSTAINDDKYYKIPKQTPFQREITEWSTDRLLAKKILYGQKYVPQKAVGLTSFAAGGGFFAVGFVQIFASIFTLSDEVTGTVPCAVGLGISTGIGMPLTIFGIKNKRKYRAITTELNKRGI